MQVKVKPDRRVVAGFGFAIMAAASYGATNVIARYVVTGMASPLVLSAFGLFFGTLFMAALSHRDIAQATHLPKANLFYLTIAGIFGAAGPTFLYLALAQAPVSVVSSVSSINPLVAIVLAHLVLKRSERVTLRLIAGALLVIGGVVLVTFGKG